MGFESGDKIDKYVVDCELGEGGLAVVYKVIHEKLNIPYALKVLKVSHPKLRERLLREGQLQAQLQHPNVVAVIDVLEVDGCPALILEFIDGQSMDDWLRDNQPTFDEAEQVFLQILDALEEAHSKSIIHRDLKPSNVMMLQTRHKLQAKVCDFGLAKALEGDGANMTRTGMTMGTPAYMAPEQVRDAKGVDQVADVFSLGAIFYELVTGQQAFTGKDTLELLNSVANLPHPPAERIVDGLPERYVNAINGALVKNPYFRIPSCSVFREVLLGERIWQTDQLAENDTIVGLNLYDDEVSVAEQISNHDAITPAASVKQASTLTPTAPLTPPDIPTNASENPSVSSIPPHVPEPSQATAPPKQAYGILVAAVLLSSLVTGFLFYYLSATPEETTNPAPSSAEPLQPAIATEKPDIENTEKSQASRLTDPFSTEQEKRSTREQNASRPSKEQQKPRAAKAKKSDTASKTTGPVRDKINKQSASEKSSGKNTLLSKALDASLSKDRAAWVESRVTNRDNSKEDLDKNKQNVGIISFTFEDSSIKDAYLSNGKQRYRKGEIPVGTYDIYLVCEDKNLQDAVGKHTISRDKRSTLSCECDFTTCE